MTQNERVLAYIKQNGSITSMQAFADLGITRLSARIKNLRDSGVSINSKMIYKTRKDGTTVHYTEYSLADGR